MSIASITTIGEIPFFTEALTSDNKFTPTRLVFSRYTLYINSMYNLLIEMGIVEDIFKNPLVLLVGFNVIVAIAGIVMMVVKRMRVEHFVFYFSEGERLYEQIKIDATTPNSLFSVKRGLRFIRTGVSYKNRLGNQVVWLAKRGTGYLFGLEDTTIEIDVPILNVDGSHKKDDGGNLLYEKETQHKEVLKKLGTLWEGLTSVLGAELIDQFTDEIKVKLMKPELFLTVELERGMEPYLGLPKLDESDIMTENAGRMSGIIFSGVKEAMKEDYIRLAGVAGIGVAVTLALIKLGVL